MWTKQYWADLIERAIRGGAAAGVGIVGTSVASNNVHADWKALGMAILLGAIVSALLSLAATQVGAQNTAALLPKGPDTEQGITTTEVLLVIVIALLVAVLLYGTGLVG